MTVNGKAAAAEIDPRTLLVQFLRENLRLTGTHVGCDTSQCGACVVHLDGRAVKSCTVLAASCDGAKVTTIEGLAKDGELHPMQEAFRAASRPAVRLLHARHDHGGRRHRADARAATSTSTPSARGSRATSAAARAITTSSPP